MAEIRSIGDMPEMTTAQWQNLVHQVDTATEERDAALVRAQAAEAKADSLQKVIDQLIKEKADLELSMMEQLERQANPIDPAEAEREKQRKKNEIRDKLKKR